MVLFFVFGAFGAIFGQKRPQKGTCFFLGGQAVLFLELLVNDSEYSQSTGTKPIFRSLLAVFISFLALPVRPYPTPPPFFLGGGKVPKRKNRLKRRGLALGHGCVAVGVAGVGVDAAC